MPISPIDYKNQYAMFGAMTSSVNNGGVHTPNKNSNEISFGQKSVEGIGGQHEAEKTTGLGKHPGANLGFVERLDKMDASNKLNHPESKSFVEGYKTGLAEKLDLIA